MLEKKKFSEPFHCGKILFNFFLIIVLLISNVVINVNGLRENEGVPSWGGVSGPVVKRGERKSVVTTENGEVSSVRIADGIRGSYHLQFITLEPNSLFLPVVLHADMIFYVHTGSGRLTWMNEEEHKSVDLRIGDVFRLPFGTIFFIESSLEPVRQKLRVYSIFANSGDNLQEPLSGPYSSIRDIVLGFDRKVLQAAFHVPESVIDEVLNGTEVPAIIHAVPKTTKKTLWEMEAQFMKSILGRGSNAFFDTQTNKKKTKLFNIFDEKPDFKNCNGWSTVITRKKLHALKGSDIGIYVVNLTKGSMMGPHWNPTATEIGIALQGEGMVRVVSSTHQQINNTRFKVEEGDVFAIPRFHPMAQMAFNNDSFVFVGFSTTAKRHHPQYLAGKASVLRALDREILAASFNVANTTVDRILEGQGESVILECVSCAEEEERLMEEARRREKEEARKREEEAEREREEERRRQEEEARRKEEEAARKAEEERRKREEEETRRREEEAAKEKEEQRRRQEEEARKREEEEARRQEEERRKRQEEEEARKKQEEEEARRRQEEEQEAARRREEEEAARRQEEKQAQREAEEAARRQQEEEAEREAEEAARRQREEQAQREAKEARRREEEAAQKQEEEAQREAEEASRREEEAEARRREEEQAQREAEEAEARKGEEEAGEGTEGGGGGSEEEQAREAERRRQEEAERQEEAARRQEEEMERRREQGTEEEGTEEEEQGPYKPQRRTFLTTA